MADHLLECFRGLLTEEDHELADLVIQAQRVSQWSYLKAVSERSAGWPTSVGGFRGELQEWVKETDTDWDTLMGASFLVVVDGVSPGDRLKVGSSHHTKWLTYWGASVACFRRWTMNKLP